MRDLINTLNKATKAYDEGHPIMTDKEWDDLYFQLKEMEKNCETVYPDSPTNIISYETVSKLNKVEHNHPMLSLDKTKEIEDVVDFIDNQAILAMLKMDGLTCSLTYNDGILVSAETRGNGHQGEDITHNAKVIPSIPSQIPYKGKLVVDGEIICKWDDFKTFEEKYENPRNFAAGSIRLLSAKECGLRKLTFVAWDAIEGLEGNSLYYNLQTLFDYGFETVPCILVKKESSKWITSKIALELVEEIKQTANFYSYPIDGIVFKYDDIAYGKSLGATTHHFKNAIAYKFYDEEYKTYLLDIEWTMGRTGVLTPVAVFEPIEIEGSTVERASLHNLSIMEETIGIPYRNQKIDVFKANMIIPQIARGNKTEGCDETVI